MGDKGKRGVTTLTRNDLLPYRDITGFNLGQIEKDYVQHLFLMNLYRRIGNELVFKGGTALQKAYGLNRFSEDLDFTLFKDTEIATVIERAVNRLNIFGCSAMGRKIKDNVMSITFQVIAKGPLYDGRDKSLTYINIEISKREEVLLPVVVNSVVPIYKDLSPYLLPIMDLSEIAAEKIRALFTRERPRDLYDLYFLIRKGIKTTIPLVNRKLSYYKKRFERDEFFEIVKRGKRMWKSELEQLVTTVPEFNEVEKTVNTLDFLKNKE
jgi:hypothetical protein